MVVRNRKRGWIGTLKRCAFLACMVTLLLSPLHSSLASNMTWEQYVLDVRNVEAEHGYYADWPLAEKERLIHALIDMGLFPPMALIVTRWIPFFQTAIYM